MGSIYNVLGVTIFALLILNILAFLICNFLPSVWERRLPSLHGRELRENGNATGAPFVSIHLAIHDEPAEVVIQTLSALRALQYDRFEVLVIDNNTPSPETWLPVQAYCRRDPRFRFHHFSGVKGAKAGALNIALGLMTPSADYVAVVDADYQVIPEFLSIAVAECQAHAGHFVQFPQAYRHAGRALAIDRELGDYFTVYSSRASNLGAMLPTGTLSLICADTLRRVGGWPCSSITEDAEIGMRMWRMGASGRYVNRVVGRGMLPLDLHGLRRQRYRWAAGNARTLLSHLMGSAAQWPRHGRWAVVAQLTAWIGFGALPLLALAAVLVIERSGSAANSGWLWVEHLASVNLMAVLLALLVTAMVRRRLETVPVKLAMFWTSSFAWLPQLWNSATPFLRTPKAAARLPFRLSIDGCISVFALLLAMGYAHLGHGIPVVALALSASALIASPFVDRALRQAAAPEAMA